MVYLPAYIVAEIICYDEHFTRMKMLHEAIKEQKILLGEE